MLLARNCKLLKSIVHERANYSYVGRDELQYLPTLQELYIDNARLYKIVGPKEFQEPREFLFNAFTNNKLEKVSVKGAKRSVNSRFRPLNWINAAE